MTPSKVPNSLTMWLRLAVAACALTIARAATSASYAHGYLALEGDGTNDPVTVAKSAAGTETNLLSVTDNGGTNYFKIAADGAVTAASAITAESGLASTAVITTTTLQSKSTITTAGLSNSGVSTVVGLASTAVLTTAGLSNSAVSTVVGLASTAVITTTSLSAKTTIQVSGTAVVGAQQANIADATTDVTAAISATYAQAEIQTLQTAISELQTQLNLVITALEAHGLLAAS